MTTCIACGHEREAHIRFAHLCNRALCEACSKNLRTVLNGDCFYFEDVFE